MQSSKHGQVDVDSLLSNLIYLFFIFFTVSYLLELTNPFRDVIDNEIQEKRSIIMYKRFQKPEISQDYFKNICNESVAPFYQFYAEYDIKAFLFPGDDNYDGYPNSTAGEIHFSRTEDELKIIAGSASTVYNTTIILQFPSWLTLKITEDIDSNDRVNKTINRYDSQVYNISLNFANGDMDKVTFKMFNAEKPLVTVEDVTGISKEKVYIGGDFKFKDTCGSELLSTKRSSVKYLSAVEKNQTSVSALISIYGWWYY